MSENPRHYYHEGIVIESSPPALLLAYAEADQGGTRLQYHYRIYYSDDKNKRAKVTLTHGYTHEREHETKEISFDEIPKSVVDDALVWLKKQLEACEQSGKSKYQKVFDRFIDIIESRKRP